MRISKTIAVSVAGLAMAGAAALPAVAGTSHHPAAGKHGTFKAKISPKSGIKSGTKVTLSAKKGAEKNTNYICVFVIVKGAKANGPDLLNAAHPKSNSKGALKCTLTFKPFKETVAGKSVNCPPTKAQTKAGYSCGMAAADPANSTGSNAFATLKF